MQGAARIEVDREGRVSLWSLQAEALFGFSSEEMLGQSIERIIPPEFRPRHTAGFRRFTRTGESRLPEISKTMGLRKDGRRARLAISVDAMRDADGRIVGVAALLKAAD